MSTATETAIAQTTQVHQLYIRASAEQIWDGITNPDLVRQYFFGAELEGDTVAGGRRIMWAPGREKLWGDNLILEADPPRRLVHAWHALYDDDLAAEAESRVTWEIEPQDGGYCKLTVIHDRLEGAPKTAASVSGGWMLVLSGLKTVLETGRPINDEAGDVSDTDG